MVDTPTTRDFFVSFNKADREWAAWIAWELEEAGHTVVFQDWDFRGDFVEQMDRAQRETTRTLAVISDHYFASGFTVSEWTARFTQDPAGRKDFIVPVKVGSLTELGILRGRIYAELTGCVEDIARERLLDRVRKAIDPDYRSKPKTRPGFPGAASRQIPSKPDFPTVAVSNVPIRVPEHFFGREEALSDIAASLTRYAGRVAITALHGLRGVGKTVLAAAYAERHRAKYRATWWLRAQTEPTLRADLVGLGVRLGWVAEDEKEEPALATVLERLRHEGGGILLIYDNAIEARGLGPCLPRDGAAQVLITSNAQAWGGLAHKVQIRLWPREVGADYLVARTGRASERADAEALSEALGFLPLAHEQAAAYCERLDVSLAEYRRRFMTAPGRLLDTDKYAPAAYHDGLTVAKAFALAIGEAAKLHPAAEALIGHLALLAPEPVPLLLFTEGREKLGAALAPLLAGDGLDEALAALADFALVDRESVPDERNPKVITDCVRLHRLVREVAAARLDGAAREAARACLVTVVANAYPNGLYNDPRVWPLARRLDPLALTLVSEARDETMPEAAELDIATLLNQLAMYQEAVLVAYAAARPLYERALAIRERVLGPDHPSTAVSLNNLAGLLDSQGDLAGARPLYERALAIYERVLGPDHPDTAISLNNLGYLLDSQGDPSGARPLYERALAIRERVLGPDHPSTAISLNNLAALLRAQGDLAGARPLYERALAIRERVLGPDHSTTAGSLNNLAALLRAQGDLAGARPLLERALAIRERALGPDHPDTAISLNNLASLLQAQGDPSGARLLYERALAIYERVLGPDHPDTATSLNNLGYLLDSQGDPSGARPLLERALAICERVLGPDHPDTAISLNNLAALLRAQGDLAGARPLYERALAIYERVLGPDHSTTAGSLNNLAALLRAQGDLAGARPLYERALAIRERALGPDHPDTAISLNNLAALLQAQGDLSGARPLFERALAIYERVLGPDHPYTATSLNNLAVLLQDLGDLAGVRPLLERALAIRERVLGPDHSTTAGSLNNLAVLLQDLGDLAGARPLLERALAIRERVLGPDHPSTATSLNYLAALLRAQGDLAGARPLLERALAIRERALGPDHPDTATNRSNLAQLFS